MNVQKMVEKERKVSFRDLIELPSTTYATFGLYRYPAKFIPHVVAYVLKNYARDSMNIFDPFAGYGTVGVVSKIYGNDYELWDLNPMLETLHDVATLETPEEINIKELIAQMNSCSEQFIPEWSKLDYWYLQEFLPLLHKAWGFYHSLQDKSLKLLMTIPLLKATRFFSFDDVQKQKLSKSPKSEKRMVEILTSDWERKFSFMVEKELNRIVRSIKEYWSLSPKRTKGVVKGGVDALTTNLEEKKDILITSPPYLQSQEYIRQAKMDLLWLGYSEDEIRALNKLEIPYRNVEPEPIFSATFSSTRNKIKESNLQELFDRYFWGVVKALTRLQEKVQSYLFLFVGRSSIRGCPIPIDRIFAEHFTTLDWVHEATLVDTIASRRMFSYRTNCATGLPDNRIRTENLVILRRR